MLVTQAPPELPTRTGYCVPKWLGRPIIPPRKDPHQVQSGHALNYYVLIPLLAILGILDPTALAVITAATGTAVSLKQLHQTDHR